MEDDEFYEKVDNMFESRLKTYAIRIKDLEKNQILTDKDMNYERVLFDSELNIYKIVEGTPVLVENSNFKAIII